MSDEYWEKKLLKYKTKYEKLETLKGGTIVAKTNEAEDFPPTIGQFTITPFEGRDSVVQEIYNTVNDYKLPKLASNNSKKCESSDNNTYVAVPCLKDTIYNPHTQKALCFKKEEYSLLLDYYRKDNSYNEDNRYQSIWRAIKDARTIDDLIARLYKACPYVATNDPNTQNNQPNYKNVIIYLDRLGDETLGFYEVYSIEVYLLNLRSKYDAILKTALKNAIQSNTVFVFPDKTTIPSFNGGITNETWSHEKTKLPKMYQLDQKIISILKNEHIKIIYEKIRQEMAFAKTREKDNITRGNPDLEAEEVAALIVPVTSKFNVLAKNIDNDETSKTLANNKGVTKDWKWTEIFFRLWNKMKYLTRFGEIPNANIIYTTAKPDTPVDERQYYKYTDTVGTKFNIIRVNFKDGLKRAGTIDIQIDTTEFYKNYQPVNIAEEKILRSNI